MTKSNEITDRFPTKTLDTSQKRLFRAASAALLAEDQALKTLFASKKNRSFYQTNLAISQGLGYWLYETTLVYTIFKAWIPLANVVWDWDRPIADETPTNGRRGPFDLTVRDRDNPQTVTMAFEAKWWNRRDGKTLVDLTGDVCKLRGYGRGARGFLMTFGRSDSRQNDSEPVQDVECVYRAHFNTHIAGRVQKPGTFSFQVFEVSSTSNVR